MVTMRIVVFVFCAISCSYATQVQQCSSIGRKFDNLQDRVQIGNCNKPPCRLRKDTFVNVTLKFQPDEEISNLKAAVSANILGIPFPFVGVDGEDACPNIYDKDGNNRIGCQLKKGQEYVYKNKFEILKVYPRLKTVVTWGLVDPKGKQVICFEVPARITN